MKGTNRIQRFAFRQKPASISDTPLGCEHGTVLDEAGVFQDVRDRRTTGRLSSVWKMMMGGARYGMSTNAGQDGDWSWAGNPLILDSDIENELEAREVSRGIKSL